MSQNGVRKRLKVVWLSEKLSTDRHAFKRQTKGEQLGDRSLCGLPREAGMRESEKPKCRVCVTAMGRGARP